MSAKLTVGRNGSLKVEGDFELLDVEGERYVLPAGKPIFICRCGQTGNTPFCDGTHGRCGFVSESKARDLTR